MKKFIALALILVSQLSFAGTILSDGEGREVVRALIDSLETSELKCFNVKGEELQLKDFPLYIYSEVYSDADLKVEISESSQPNIRLSLTSYNDDIVTMINTDESLTKIQEMKMVILKITRTTKNVGTLTRPQYKEITTHTVTHSGTCK